MTQSEYEKALNKVEGLEAKVSKLAEDTNEKSVFKEFLLTALAEFSRLERKQLKQGSYFQDYFKSVVGGLQ